MLPSVSDLRLKVLQRAAKYGLQAQPTLIYNFIGTKAMLVQLREASSHSDLEYIWGYRHNLTTAN